MFLEQTRCRIVSIAISLLLTSLSISAQTVQVKYEPTNEDIANPERGLFQYDDDRDGDREPLDENELRAERTNKNRTVVYRHYTLVTFRKRPLDESYLSFLTRDAAIARKAGVKMIVRFAYTDSCEAECINLKDPPVTRVLEHLTQLKDYFQNNADVITVVEAGFIGAWGEWFYSNNDFGCSDNPPYHNRAKVLWRLLEILPSNRMVAIRAAYHKRAVIEEWKKQNQPQAMIDAFSARIGYHNDGFLADATDLQTFRTDVDRVMTARDTLTMPMLGETSINNLKPGFNPFSTWDKAKDALSRYHWSLISGTDDALIFTSGYICQNADGGWERWDGTSSCNKKFLIERWTDEQRNEIRKNLGYRFVLVDGTYPQKAKAGDEIDIKLNIKNEGSASPFNQRPVFLALRSGANNMVMFELKDLDPRQWRAQTPTPIDARIRLPIAAELPAGAYDLYLYLPDPMLNSSSCATKGCDPAAYAIRFANKDLWELIAEKPTGYNSLKHRLIVE